MTFASNGEALRSSLGSEAFRLQAGGHDLVSPACRQLFEEKQWQMN
jgi:hypothetical protein